MRIDSKIMNKKLSSIKLKINLCDFLQRNQHLIIILLCSSFLYLISLLDDSSLSLAAHDEGLYSRRARVIADSGRWFDPFDEPHHKTIGSYWFIALSIKLFGTNEFAVRLPSVIFSILCGLIIYKIACSIFNPKVAFISSLLLPVMPIWFQYSNYASPDMAFVFFTLLAINFIVKANFKLDQGSFNSHILWLLAGISFSISFFLRSFMLVLPLIALTPYLFSSLIRHSPKSTFYFLLGITIGLIPTIINVSYAYNSHGVQALLGISDFAQHQAFNNDETGFSLFNKLSDYSFYPLIIFLLSFPIGAISIYGFIKIYHQKHQRDKFLLLGFPLITLLVLILVSTKLSHYTLLIYPWIAILAGFSIDTSLTDNFIKSQRFRKILSYVFLLTGLILFGLLIVSGIYFTSSLYLNKTILIILSLLAIAYLLAAFLLLSNLKSKRNFSSGLTGILIIQAFVISTLFHNGIIGNPNSDLKHFLSKPIVAEIIKNNNLYLIDVNTPTKERTLLEFYLPSYYHYDKDLSRITTEKYFLVSQKVLDELSLDSRYSYQKIGNYRYLSLIDITIK